MEVVSAVVHFIEKKQHTGAAQVHSRNDLLPVDENTRKLARDVVELYGRTSNIGYGSFDSNEEAYRFAPLLREYVSEERTLIDFSLLATELLKSQIESESASTGGYMLLVRYKFMDRDWLIVVMLKLRLETGIDKTTLNLNGTEVFDVRYLHEAARIDLGKWLANGENYVSFAKGKVNGQDITKYFRRALGCTDYSDSKLNTALLVKALNAFSENMNSEVKNEMKQKFVDYCAEKHESREPVSLAAFSSRLNESDPEEFVRFVREREDEFPITDGFDPHKATFIALRRIRSKWSTISIGFDVKDIADGRIVPNGNGSITITDIPKDLEAQIMEYKSP